VGLLEYLGDHFYAPLDTARGPVIGQIAWAPIPNLNPQPQVLEAERINDRSHGMAKARWVVMNDKHFTRRSRNELPILHLHLAETEELVVYKAKRRPGIVVGIQASVLGGLELAPHHEENRIVIAPIYGIRTEDDPSGFSRDMATRIRHLLYKQYFPVASWTETRPSTRTPGACRLEEGIARFDRLQFLKPASPGCRFVPLRLSDDAIALLHATLWAYFHYPAAKELIEMRDFLHGELPEELRPQN